MELNNSSVYQLNCSAIPGKRESLIRFYLPQKSNVLLKIFNKMDVEIRMLLNEALPIDHYEVSFLYDNLQTDSFTIKLIVQTDAIIDIQSLIIQIP